MPLPIVPSERAQVFILNTAFITFPDLLCCRGSRLRTVSLCALMLFQLLHIIKCGTASRDTAFERRETMDFPNVSIEIAVSRECLSAMTALRRIHLFVLEINVIFARMIRTDYDLLRIHELRARWSGHAVFGVGLESMVVSRGIAVGKCMESALRCNVWTIADSVGIYDLRTGQSGWCGIGVVGC